MELVKLPPCGSCVPCPHRMLDKLKYLASPLWITPEQQDNGWAMWLRKLLDKVLTGRELLQYKRFITYPVPWARRINTVLALLSLEEWADKRIGTYSGVCLP